MDLYSRQLYALGKESLITMKNARVLIIGTNTPFVEILKNLILMGIGEITITDNRQIQDVDIYTNYYLNSNDIGKDFVDVVGFRMQKLNPTIIINKYSKTELTDDFLKLFSIIIVLKDNYNLGIRLHNLGLPHIQARTSNFFGYIFVDYIKFLSLNPNGEKIKSGLILKVDEIKVDTIIETVDIHNLSVGNKIKIQNDIYTIIKILSPKKFIIDKHILCKTQLEKYEEIKICKDFQFESIDKCNIKSKIVETDYIHFGSTYNILEQLYKSNFKFENSDYGFVFINSIIGGIVAQNIINYINKNSTPIDQFLIYNFDELKSLMEGNKFNSSVIDKKVFIVGAGALGCEHIKNLAYVGVKNIIITDFDQIEKSNLSRQFLFRNVDIGKFKSIQAKKAIRKMKSNINVEALTLKVSSNTESKFDSKFYDELDCVFNALDNIEARKYVDSKCVDYDLPLFESGTLGSKANSQTIIPYLTESYSNSVNDDTTTIPMCTIKSFPYLPEHTVMWAKELFAELFSETIDKVESLDLNKIYQDRIIDDINKLTEKYPENYVENQIKFWCGTRKFPNISYLNNTNLQKEFYDFGNAIKNRIIKNKTIEEFNKDSVDLFHVEFLTVLTNIRNTIYSIEIIDDFTVKGIAGKIIPALCTTTSIISGLVMVEFLRYCLNGNNNIYSNNYINLSLNLYANSSPIESNVEWTKLNLTDLTLEDILIKIQNEYDEYVSSIYINDKLIYSSNIDYELSYLKSKLRDSVNNPINNPINKIFGFIILDNDTVDILRFYL